MAISVSRDVISYCVKKGSPIFASLLFAEGAFDGIPHSVLFDKCIGILPDVCWQLLYFWYHKLTVQIRWNNVLSDIIRVERDTRQGSLSSPFLFTIFYQDMIVELSNTIGGIWIDNTSYNVSCYAGDVLLTSTTVTGLQRLIDVADKYISSHSLGFNPINHCITFVKTSFVKDPEWSLDGTVLTQSTNITYLGANLSNNYNHIESRIKSCRKAFSAMQSTGFCKGSLAPDTIAHIWKIAIQPIMLYATQCYKLTKTSL